MNLITKNWPLVRRGAHQLQTYDMDAKRTGGAKNHDRVMDSMTPSYNISIRVAQLNCRTLSQDHQVDYLIEQFDKMDLDIMCLNETRRREKVEAKWHTGHQVFLSAHDKNRVGGVGFIISQKWEKRILSCTMSSRHAVMILKIDAKTTLKMISCYAPTSAADDEEIEDFYEKLESCIRPSCTYTVIAGDLNAKIGHGDQSDRYIGPHGKNDRNERGERLATFSEVNRFYVMNTFFKKRLGRRWTWISPNKEVKNEIDYIMTNNKRIIQDIKAIGFSQFDVFSDHKLLLAKVSINCKQELKFRQAKAQSGKREEINKDAFQKRCGDEDWDISSDDIDVDYDNFVKKFTNLRKESNLPPQPTRRDRLQPDTRELLKKRKELKENGLEYTIVAKLLRKKMKEDYDKYRSDTLIKAAESKSSIKKAERNISLKSSTPTNLINESGEVVSNRKQMEEIVNRFYNNLFKSQKSILPPDLDPAPVPEFLEQEVSSAIKECQLDKSPGVDTITNRDLKLSADSVVPALTKRFNWYLRTGEVPRQWKASKTVLIFKKGATNNIQNYRPICLLSAVYKIFSRLILNRIRGNLNEECSREQAGFRKGFSTVDHIHSIRQIIQKHNGHNVPLYLLFIDFKKAFDSVEHNAILNALKVQGIQDQYIKLVQSMNSSTMTSIKLFNAPIDISIERGVRQGDVISPNLFVCALEDVFRNINFEPDEGLMIDGEALHYLAFADDIVLLANSSRSLESMLSKVHSATKEIGLKIHPDKTKWMTNQSQNTTVKLNGHDILQVHEYKYLGQMLTPQGDMLKEVNSRIRSGWAAFKRIEPVLTSSVVDKSTKVNLFNSNVLPAMTYASETWATTQNVENKIRTAQRAMERRMTKISKRQHIRSTIIREKSGVKDVVERIYEQKHRWAGHVARFPDNRWTYRTTCWYPYDHLRKKGRPNTRWEDPLLAKYGRRWTRIAQDRNVWRKNGDGLHQWRSTR